ncbi:MAG TPA: HEAT repeat domain-containing protein [Longimicrobium sp.]
MKDQNTGSALLVDLSRGFALSEFYPHRHPTLTHGILKLEQAILGGGEDLKIDVNPGGLALAGQALPRRSPHAERFAARLQEHGVRSVVLRHDIGSDGLGRFLAACALPVRMTRAGGGFVAVLEASGTGRVAVNGGWIKAPPEEERAVRVDSGISLWSTHDMYEEVALSAQRVAAEDVVQLRRMLREGTDSQWLEALRRLELVAQDALHRGETERAVSLIHDLRRDAELIAGRAPATRAAVMLALHHLANAAIIEELVARLGRSRTEEERGGLRSTLLHLGAEVVTPLVRALISATDLSARRAYRDTLVALDGVGVSLLEDMVGDERWFVVRNMVGILGEIRSADALHHFARTVVHGDARVRRETILALSKLGGEESVGLLVKGLADREAGLRSAAALGLGLTKSPAAVTPLLGRLQQETDVEAVTEMIRALGRIGDPRAVPALAERAAGGFFSRTPVVVRVEAARALGEVGGEAAREVLQRLVRDRAGEVREAAFRALTPPEDVAQPGRA